MRVNLGCPKPCPGFDRCIDQLTSPEVSVYRLEQTFAPGSVDYAYSKNLLEHLGNPLEFLESVRRILRVGGTLDLVTDNAQFAPFYWRSLAPLNRWFRYGVFGIHAGAPFQCAAGAHYAIFTEAHLRQLFDAAGLAVAGVETGVFQGRVGRVGLSFAPRLRVVGVRPPDYSGPPGRTAGPGGRA
jgi:SAM-dependent methyltransferase